MRTSFHKKQIITFFNLIALLALTAFSAVKVSGSDGDIDLTFGTHGIVTDTSPRAIPLDIAVQPDGKIIVTGADIVVRYNSDGSIDTTFGNGGRVQLQVNKTSEVILQADGKIVLVGTSGSSPSGDFYVTRLNQNGSLDSSFNGSGVLVIDLRGTNDSATSVAIQPDGKIVVGGSSVQPGSGSTSDFAVIRLNPDGSIDTTFDGDGKVFTTLQDGAGINDLAIQPDGKIVAAGQSYLIDQASHNPNGWYATVRYNADGSIDITFNTTGFALAQFDLNGSPGNLRSNTPEQVILRPEGQILIVGTTDSCCSPEPRTEVAMIQYNANGSPDTAFGNGGKAQASFLTYPKTAIYDAAVQADNKIVVTGYAQGNVKSNHVAILGRFNSKGFPDPAFSGDGWSVVPIPDSISVFGGLAVAPEPDGKLVVGGIDAGFFLARFNASLCTLPCIIARQNVADFDGDGRTDASVFRNGTWFINPSGANDPNSYYGIQFGLSTDRLTPADFDGDGKTDVAIWRENVNGTFGYFYILQSASNTVSISQFGQTGDDPRIVGDWDGDGKADLAVYRAGSSAGAQSFFFYRPSTQPSEISVLLIGASPVMKRNVVILTVMAEWIQRSSDPRTIPGTSCRAQTHNLSIVTGVWRPISESRVTLMVMAKQISRFSGMGSGMYCKARQAIQAMSTGVLIQTS